MKENVTELQVCMEFMIIICTFCRFAALRNGDTCLCGNSYGSSGNTGATCTTPCTGESADCGSNDAWYVYSTPKCDIGMTVGLTPSGKRTSKYHLQCNGISMGLARVVQVPKLKGIFAEHDFIILHITAK